MTSTQNKQKKALPDWVDLPMAVAALLTVAFYVIVYREFPKGSLIHRYTTEHVVEYVVVAFFIWGIVDVVFKLCGFPLEVLALRQPGLPERNGKEPVANARALYAQLLGRPKWFLDSRYGQRLAKALGYLQEKESADGFHDYLRYLATQDEEKTHGNYGLVRFICWVAPVLGILGTVIHFGSAFGGLSVDEIGDNLAKVVGEIGTAFNTTTVALAAAITMMFSLFMCEKTERGIIHSISRRVDLELLNRFEVTDESLTPFLQAVQVGNQATLTALDSRLEKQLQIWASAFTRLQQESDKRLQTHGQMWEQSLSKMHAQFEHSDTQREQKLLKLLSEMQLQRTEQKSQGQAMLNQMTGLQTHFAQLVEALAGLNRGESELAKSQQLLAQNLQGIRETGHLDQALHGLTAAIHLLTARHDLDPKKASRAA
ncbi:MAG TPA: MotA/TolQ/ExbB proton channel family protein [Pirellulales bacterium]|nr:MotA/TolQ/ExbB proton channel family protein [Pirellulales bacterium]